MKTLQCSNTVAIQTVQKVSQTTDAYPFLLVHTSKKGIISVFAIQILYGEPQVEDIIYKSPNFSGVTAPDALIQQSLEPTSAL